MTHKPTLNFDEIVAELGGMNAVATVLDVSAQAVWNMKARGSFPHWHWAALVAEGKRLDKPAVTLEALSAISAARPRKTRVA